MHKLELWPASFHTQGAECTHTMLSIAFPLCSMKQIREEVKKEDTVVKSKTTHHSQTDAAKGFGGKFGVQKERQDKVQSNVMDACPCFNNLCRNS